MNSLEEKLRDIDRIVLKHIQKGNNDVQKITEATTLENHHVSYSFKKLEKLGLITVEKPDKMIERVINGQKRVFQHPKQAELTEKGLQCIQEHEPESVAEYERLSHDELVKRVKTIEKDLDELQERFKLFKKQIQKKI